MFKTGAKLVLLPQITVKHLIWRFNIMSSNTLTKKRRVINYLASGKGLTPNEARSRFGVANLRATISDIRSQVEQYGNWEITTEETSTGMTRYFMEDTHPGNRTYGFDKNGMRHAI
jgi:hypothetical protein